jgi:hypothetical protein
MPKRPTVLAKMTPSGYANAQSKGAHGTAPTENTKENAKESGITETKKRRRHQGADTKASQSIAHTQTCAEESKKCLKGSDLLNPYLDAQSKSLKNTFSRSLRTECIGIITEPFGT